MTYEELVELARRDAGVLGLVRSGLGDVIAAREPDVELLRGRR